MANNSQNSNQQKPHQMEHYVPIIDADFSEVKESLAQERSMVPVTPDEQRKGPISPGSLRV